MEQQDATSLLKQIHEDLDKSFQDQLPGLRQVATYFKSVRPARLDPLIYQSVEEQVTRIEKQLEDADADDDLQEMWKEVVELAGRLSGFVVGNQIFSFAANSLIKDTRRLGDVLLLICDLNEKEQ